MSALLEKLKKNSTIKETNILADSVLFSKKDMIPTKIPAINVALSGRLGLVHPSTSKLRSPC
jgi:hypothetical protein